MITNHALDCNRYNLTNEARWNTHKTRDTPYGNPTTNRESRMRQSPDTFLCNQLAVSAPLLRLNKH